MSSYAERQRALRLKREEKRKRPEMLPPLHRRPQVWMVVMALAAATYGVLQGPAVIRQAVAAMAVLDASNLAKNAETALSTAKMLTNIEKQLGIVTEQLGVSEIMRKNLGEGMDIASATRLFQSQVNSGQNILGQAQSMKNSAANLERSLGAIGQGGGGLGTLQDANQAISRVRSLLSQADAAKGKLSTENDKMKQWHSARDAAREDALGVALLNRQTAASAPDNISALSAKAEAAAKPEAEGGNLRSQVAVLNASVLNNTEQLVQLRGLMAAHVQMEAAKNIAAQPLALVPMETPQTGSSTSSLQKDGSIFGGAK